LLQKHRARYLQLPGIETRCAKPRDAEILVLLQDPWAKEVLQYDRVSLLNEDPTAGELRTALSRGLNQTEEEGLNSRIFVWNTIPWYSPFANGKFACRVCQLLHHEFGSELLPILLSDGVKPRAMVVCGKDAYSVYEGAHLSDGSPSAIFIHHPSYYVRGERGNAARARDKEKLIKFFTRLGLRQDGGHTFND
jgi:hypothetical protein